MIASLRGTVLTVRLDSAVVEVGGVGLQVQSTPATLADLRHGTEALLHTSLVVREDSLTLFGFATSDERDTFVTVQNVSGLGPRLALAMLAVLDPEQLRRAIAGNDLKALTRVPGVGPKLAQRIVLELADRIGAPSGSVPVPGAVPVAAAAAARAPSPVVEALVGLGWSVKQAEDAVVAVRSGEGATGTDPTAPVAPAELPGLLRAALQHLGRR